MKNAFRQIVVHFDNTLRCTERLAVARRIAHDQGGVVSVLYDVAPAYTELPYVPEIGPSSVAAFRELEERLRLAAKTRFEEALAANFGPRATWASTNEFPTIGAFIQQALYADLLVLGQRNPADPLAADVPSDFVQSVVIGSGKPALVVPYTGSVPASFDTVAVAWKATREAARAVGAALPLLQRARRVVVLGWGDAGSPVHGAPLGLREYLRLHGVEAEWKHQRGSEPAAVGEMLLSAAADAGADLLVMGCYGHSRAREWVLGGASRTLLQSMTLPVLMAH